MFFLFTTNEFTQKNLNFMWNVQLIIKIFKLNYPYNKEHGFDIAKNQKLIIEKNISELHNRGLKKHW